MLAGCSSSSPALLLPSRRRPERKLTPLQPSGSSGQRSQTARNGSTRPPLRAGKSSFATNTASQFWCALSSSNELLLRRRAGRGKARMVPKAKRERAISRCPNQCNQSGHPSGTSSVGLIDDEARTSALLCCRLPPSSWSNHQPGAAVQPACSDRDRIAPARPRSGCRREKPARIAIDPLRRRPELPILRARLSANCLSGNSKA